MFRIFMGTSCVAALARFVLVFVALPLTLAFGAENIPAPDDKPSPPPDRYGIATSYGYGYDTPNNLQYCLITGVALFDYAKVWHHSAPTSLRFKLEVSAGTTTDPMNRFMGSVNMFALYYLDALSVRSFRPYIEGGIGGIYTDFQEKGQGSKFNFNPQAGVGSDFTIGRDLSLFAAVRAHHFSNAGLADQNRGINSVLFVLGHYF